MSLFFIIVEDIINILCFILNSLKYFISLALYFLIFLVSYYVGNNNVAVINKQNGIFYLGFLNLFLEVFFLLFSVKYLFFLFYQIWSKNRIRVWWEIVHYCLLWNNKGAEHGSVTRTFGKGFFKWVRLKWNRVRVQ